MDIEIKIASLPQNDQKIISDDQQELNSLLSRVSKLLEENQDPPPLPKNRTEQSRIKKANALVEKMNELTQDNRFNEAMKRLKQTRVATDKIKDKYWRLLTHVKITQMELKFLIQRFG